MGNSIHLRSSVTNMVDIAKIQNVDHHRADIHHQQTSALIQKEAALKETQVQMPNKADSTEIQTKRKLENKGKKNPRKKQTYKKNGKDEDDNSEEEGQVVDFKID